MGFSFFGTVNNYFQEKKRKVVEVLAPRGLELHLSLADEGIPFLTASKYLRSDFKIYSVVVVIVVKLLSNPAVVFRFKEK